MKRLLAITEPKNASLWKATLVFCLTISLASAFWAASAPIVQAAQMTPAELIQSRLPSNKTLTDASDGQLLEAVYQAVKQSPKDARLIVRTASGARKPLRPNILCTAVRAQRERHSLNCTWVANVLREWIKADPADANRLTEATAQCAEECSETLQMGPHEPEGEGNFVTPPSNVNPAPGLGGGGGVASSGNTCTVCRNGHDMQIGCPAVAEFLRTHPGSTAGPCQITPVTNP